MAGPKAPREMDMSAQQEGRADGPADGPAGGPADGPPGAGPADRPPGPWPTFVICGAPRSGTTSLHRYLGQHPDVFMSPVKETHFFGRRLDEAEAKARSGEDPSAVEHAEAWYLELFAEGKDATARGEATPAYFYHPKAADRIASYLPGGTVLFLLRDPIERAHSHFCFRLREGYLDTTFEAFLEDRLAKDPRAEEDDYLRVGRYHTHVSRYVDAVGEDRVKVLLFDHLKERPLDVLEDVAPFLGVDPGPMADVEYGKKHNPYGRSRNRLAHFLRTDDRVRRAARLVLPKPVRIWLGEDVLLDRVEKPPLTEEAVEMLRPLYAPEVERLEELLGRELPELKRTWAGDDA